MLQWPPKDPDEILDYQVDWTDRLGEDTIATSAFTVPAGLTKDSESSTDTAATVWLSGGTLAASYEILNRITTAGGRTMDQTVKIRIKAK
jgi:hypothetical protein